MSDGVAELTQGTTHHERLAMRERGLNLLLLTDSFLPHAGGSRVYYHTIYTRLTEQYPDRVAILTKRVPGWRDFDSTAATRQLRIIRRFRPLENWKWYQIPKLLPCFLDTLLLLQRQSFDMIHVGDLFPQGVIAMVLKKALGMPYLVYCHGEEITQTDGRRYQPRLRDAIYHSADAVIAANEFARSNLMRIGVAEERIVKITPGVDSQRFAPRKPAPNVVGRLDLQGKIVLLTVGRLVPRKGHRVVIEALATLRDEVPPFHYLIAGEGPEKSAITSRAAQLGLRDRVTLLGKVPDDKLPDVYSLCDLFVLCNREVRGDLEGFGMVFLEANAAGKPVLGGRTGGACEAILDQVTGLLVDPENQCDVVRSLQRLLLDSDLRQSLGQAGRARVSTDFLWQSRAIQLHQACSQLSISANSVRR